MIRPALYTVSVQVEQICDEEGTRTIDVTVDDEGRECIVQWLSKERSEENKEYLMIADHEGDVFAWRPDLIRSVEIVRDTK